MDKLTIAINLIKDLQSQCGYASPWYLKIDKCLAQIDPTYQAINLDDFEEEDADV